MPNKMRVADEVWLVVASLHQQHADREDFSIGEIMKQAELRNFSEVLPLRSSLKMHAYLHCVANKAPNPGRYRMLFETKPGYRRLFRPRDVYHPDRKGGKVEPRRQEIPQAFHGLLEWYEKEFAHAEADSSQDPLTSLRGLGREIWASEDADEYVSTLRAGWK